MTNNIGASVSRVDGHLKVTGAARYSAEVELENIAHAFLVTSRIAKGRILSIDHARAENAPGVLHIVTPANALKLKSVGIFSPGGSSSGVQPAAASRVQPLQDDEIFYRGQPVAVVVAETLEDARFAAGLIQVEYGEQTPIVDFNEARLVAVAPKTVWGQKPAQSTGDADAALANAAVKVDEVYRTPFLHHNTIEMHSTIARWTDEKLTVFDSSRYTEGERQMLADSFGLRASQVRVVAKFIGGAFGSKGAVRPHVVLTAMCAMQLKRPIKTMLTRAQVTESCDHRPTTHQRVALGAGKNGKLVSIIHAGESSCAATDEFVEPFTTQTFHLYASPNRRIGQKIVHLNTAQPTTMRAPGEATGMFALESAMDELAFKLNICPLELRRINEPAVEPITNKLFSNRRLLRCVEQGAQMFDWTRRKMQPGAVRENDCLIGYGFAASTYPFKGAPTKASCRILADGTAIVASSTHDFGNGAGTTITQIAADALNLPLEKVRFDYADTDLPDAPVTGGSTTTMWVGTAVKNACDAAREKLFRLAVDDLDSPLSGESVKNLAFADNRLFLKQNPNKGEDLATILKRTKREFVEAEGAAKPSAAKKKRFAMDSYAAHFCEVAVDELTLETRVRRFVSVFNCGRIINPKLASSQFKGAIVMGLGMALMEQNHLDLRLGKWMHRDLAEYHVPTAADTPEIQVAWLDDADENANALGVRGAGEIGIVGAAAAVANAVFNATGKRIRTLPITADKLL